MKYLGPLVVLACIVAGFAYYALFAGPSLDRTIGELESEVVAAPNTDSAPPEEERETFRGEGTLGSLFARGDSLECAITYIPNPLEPEITGGIFTAEGQFRGDFVVPTPDLSGQMVSSIIVSAGSVWQWTDIDGEVVGSVGAFSSDQAELERLIPPVGFTTTVQYDCLTWPNVDRTIFEAPATVLFTNTAEAIFEEGIIFEDES